MKYPFTWHKRVLPAVISLSLATVSFAQLTQLAHASELVYEPYNPSFGGNPLNGSVLMNSALETRKHKDPDIDKDRYGIDDKSGIEEFNATLERSIINRLSASASSKIIDTEGNFIPGTLETENFNISISDIGGGMLSVSTTDRVTGATTIFEVNKR